MRAPYAAIWNEKRQSESAGNVPSNVRNTYLEILLAHTQLTQKSPYLNRDVSSQRGPLGRKGGLRATAEPAGERLLEEQERCRGDTLGSQRSGGESGEVSSEKSVQDELCG